MALATGSRLGPYEISSPLGSGGMGEVYRARDTRLQRDVALKILPAAFEQDLERLARFTREAQALAALNHPHIAQVYGIEHASAADSVRHHAIVMELVEGQTLAERIAQGPIPAAEATVIARQIADALDTAHERGIVHRDLKPANIKLTPDGIVKVLDFGLAKLDAPGVTDTAGADLLNSPTIAAPAVTNQGVILGTAPYMSPEQARGRPVDKRTDIWAFGVVLYEMLTGRTLFAGDTVSDTIAEVLKRDIDLAALPADTTPALRHVIARCLERDPKKRLRDIADAAFELDRPADAPVVQGPAAAPATARWVVGAVAVAVTAAALTWTLSSPRLAEPIVARASYPMPDDAFRRTVQRHHIAISPDGRYIATLNGRSVSLRRVDQLEWVPMPGTDGAVGVTFSPDSRWVGFWTPREIRKAPVSGGDARTIYQLAEAQTNGPDGVSWGDDGTVYFATGMSRIHAVPENGGTARQLIEDGVDFVGYPYKVRGVRTLLYLKASAASASSLTVMAHSLDGGDDVPLLEGRTPHYLESGWLLVVQSNTLVAVRADLTARRLSGEPTAVLRGVATLGAAAQYAVADTGTLLYVPEATATETVSTLHRVKRDGAATELTTAEREYSDPRLSPDDRRVALHLSDQQNDIWVNDLARGSLTRITFAPLEEETPAWSPDGEWLAYSGWCGNESSRCIYKHKADGSGEPERLWSGKLHVHVTDWTPDGRALVLEVVDPVRFSDLMLIDAGGGELQPYLSTPYSEQAARVSPDGKWLAYQSNESGRFEMYLQRFPTPGGKVQVSTDGGIQPVWSRDGRELYYRSPTHVMAAGISSLAPLVVGAPVQLFRDGYLRPQGDSHTTYDVFRDGSFLFIDLPKGSERAVPSFVAVFNWFEELTAALRR
jgi:eukaryotic-like serine/threonine-protein kinase